MAVELYYYDYDADEGFSYETDITDYLDNAPVDEIVSIYKAVYGDPNQFDASFLKNEYNLNGNESDEELVERIESLRSLLTSYTDEEDIFREAEDDILMYYVDIAKKSYNDDNDNIDY